MINNVTLVGRLTKDPELRYTPNGVAVCRFTLAVNRTFNNSNGERDADFIQVVLWRKAAENAANFLKKGSLAGVTGRLQTGSYEGQDNKRVYTTEVIGDSIQFLEPRGDNSSANGNNRTSNQNQGSGNQNTQYSQSQSNNQQNQFNQSQNNAQNNNQHAYQGANNYFDGQIEVSDDDLPF